jgi:hypothetical protein
MEEGTMARFNIGIRRKAEKLNTASNLAVIQSGYLWNKRLDSSHHYRLGKPFA